MKVYWMLFSFKASTTVNHGNHTRCQNDSNTQRCTDARLCLCVHAFRVIMHVLACIIRARFSPLCKIEQNLTQVRAFASTLASTDNICTRSFSALMTLVSWNMQFAVTLYCYCNSVLIWNFQLRNLALRAIENSKCNRKNLIFIKKVFFYIIFIHLKKQVICFFFNLINILFFLRQTIS